MNNEIRELTTVELDEVSGGLGFHTAFQPKITSSEYLVNGARLDVGTQQVTTTDGTSVTVPYTRYVPF